MSVKLMSAVFAGPRLIVAFHWQASKIIHLFAIWI